jgi:hypothetical protein
MKQVISVPEEIDDCTNLVLNMMSGLLPEHLTRDEVEILTKHFGSNWFTKLGYNEPEYARPKV